MGQNRDLTNICYDNRGLGVLDHASMPNNWDPAPGTRSCQKIYILSGNRTISKQNCLIPKTCQQEVLSGTQNTQKSIRQELTE